MTRLPRVSGRTKGFTLVEMLVVSALIALFAGLAVFSITTQLEQNKKKAAVAECRQIATAMSFAQQDLGFFPKLSFLKFNVPSIKEALTGLPLTTGALDYYGYPIPGLSPLMLDRKWKGVYMTNNPDRLVDMTIQTGGSPGTREMRWPADPWGNPYVAYLLSTTRPRDQSQPTQQFLQSSGEEADYFAGIVSYGRNGVPGLGDNDLGSVAAQNRLGLRLYTGNYGSGKFALLPVSEFAASNPNAALRRDVFLPSPSGTTDPVGPHSLDPGSDDRVYQF